ncbi:hypothetical protein Asp14428_09870 [Actinoplanes sp. NBRC 14428]|uniref:Glycine zipper family protein n=1 Tax=Pseudosporangium ferrugineum TaxID=439699 RepID=A0A2T0SFQ3_9ACTN|nr:hypothetical protein [Pseudosporangium ferrugineum]PRY32240.1 hypothetical protein CLV70_102451 [Pseudosporangium ferrugineum]BCJ49512.1 hypothetical protein Asp14428_09870 [Actinoplanes sp. NBRC 14428]
MTSNNPPPDAAGQGIWRNLAIWIAFGALFGVVGGGLLDNVGLGIALGSCLGVAAWAIFIAPRRNSSGGS